MRSRVGQFKAEESRHPPVFHVEGFPHLVLDSLVIELDGPGGAGQGLEGLLGIEDPHVWIRREVAVVGRVVFGPGDEYGILRRREDAGVGGRLSPSRLQGRHIVGSRIRRRGDLYLHDGPRVGPVAGYYGRSAARICHVRRAGVVVIARVASRERRGRVVVEYQGLARVL